MGTSLRPTLAAVVAVFSLLVAGCSGDPDPADQPSGEAQSAPAEDDGVEPADDGAADGGEEVDVDEFVADMRAGLDAATTARTTMSVDGGGQRLQTEGLIDYTTDPPSMQMSTTMPGLSSEELEVRLVDGTVYMNMGRMSLGRFLAFDVDDPSGAPRGMGGVAEQLDPLEGFEEFERSITDVTFVGTEELDGESLDHYRVTADTELSEGFRGVPRGRDVPDEFTFDYWVDDQFRARRMTTSVDEGRQSVTMDMRLSDWDTPVDIEAPPARDVLDPTDMRGLG